MSTLRCRLRRDAQKSVQGKLSKGMFFPSCSLCYPSFGIFSLSVQNTVISSCPKYVLWISPFLAFTFLFKLNFWPLNFEAFCQPHLTHTRLPLLTWMSMSQTCLSTILALKSPRTSANQRWWDKASLLSEPSGFPSPRLLFFGRLNDLYLVLTGFPGGSAPLRWLSRQSLPAMRGARVQSVGKSPGKRNGSPFQYLAWGVPWTEETGGLQSMGSHTVRHIWVTNTFTSLSGGSNGKEFACNEEDLGSIPGLGRSPEGGHGNPLQYTCLENPDRWRSLTGYSPGGCKESMSD